LVQFAEQSLQATRKVDTELLTNSGGTRRCPG